MQKINIAKDNIINFKGDAIVNAANEHLLPGGGVCGSIFEAAGSQMDIQCRYFGHCDTGKAVLTSGCNLPVSYVIHAVGPKWIDGRSSETLKLYEAYQSALKLAAIWEIKDIAFPLISAGIYGFPIDIAWDIAIKSVRDFSYKYPEYKINVTFMVINDNVYKIGIGKLQEGDISFS